MIDLEKEQTQKPKAFLVGEPNTSLKELEGLVDTLGMEVVESFVLQRLDPEPKYGIGTGKANDIAYFAKEAEADCIIFDFELSPTKQRNWEKLADIPVFDRQEVIIRIFGQRAKTKEAMLQVELAKLQYSLPRLAHSYGEMSRQRGGSYGSKGSGETQLELDRRGVEARIHIIKQELKKVIKERETMRKRRERTPVPTCALVGYTNAGKSSLLNALTGAEAFVEDRLFATLDPTTRKLQLKDGGSVLLTDTVGFISNLPHTLIDAFKSTLEEAARADLLLIVLDSSDQNAISQYQTVMEVLAETGAGEKEKIIVLNKVDKITEDNLILKSLENEFAAAIKVSAKEKTGFLELAETINEKLLGPVKTFKLPLDRIDLVTLIRRTGVLYKEEWLEDHILVEGRLGGVISSSQRTLNLVEEAEIL